jgi:hypothetical protein
MEVARHAVDQRDATHDAALPRLHLDAEPLTDGLRVVEVVHLHHKVPAVVSQTSPRSSANRDLGDILSEI